MWAILIVTLPTQPNAVRVRIWRALKALGCAALRDGAYLLPTDQQAVFEPLAQEVRDLASYARDHRVTIAVMGCRVNGPGETDDADLGLWCGPSTVVLKKKDVKIGSYRYNEVLPRLKEELDRLIAEGAV